MSDRFTDSNMSWYASRYKTTAVGSVDSDILSGSAQQSSDCVDSEWVLFSPAVEEEELSSLSQQDIADVSNTEDSHDVAINGSDLLPGVELPTHNGAGSFSTPNASRKDLLERINAWRLEQSEYFFRESELNYTIPFHQTRQHNEQSMWQKLKHTAKQCIDWDDRTIDALFSKDFSTSNQSDQKFEDRTYLERARHYGPPGWEQHMLESSKRPHSTGLLMSLLTKLLLWSYDSKKTNPSKIKRPADSAYHYEHAPQHEHDHSYHLNAIQNSIATITSTTTATLWSNTWDTNTTTTSGVAA